MEVPGIGIALRVDEEVVEYRYLPFAKPVPKAALDVGFTSADLKRFKTTFIKADLLFAISLAPFFALSRQLFFFCQA